MGLKGLDLDGNGYADMAIGAPLSDSVVVLRSRPIINLPCKYDKRYKVSLLLKADPVNAWLTEWTEPDDDQMRTITRDRRKVAGECVLSHKSTEQQIIPNTFQIYRDLAIAAVSFIGERSVQEFGNQSDPFFTVNKSANSAGVQSPGGYLPMELEATCRELSDVRSKKVPTPEELVAAKKLRLVFRLTFDNQCTARICCPHLKVRSHVNVAPNAASCHLANPLWPGQSAECTLRWLVIGHQLAVQMAQFSVNSSIVTGAEAPVTVEGSLTHELRVNIKMIANISITGTIDPNTVYFSGNVSDGISSILAENQIGDSQLLIKFTVSFLFMPNDHVQRRSAKNSLC
ncbi:hypothetical protein AHF37_06547 [Paragonimus kellicotti]|nr:hypothetical protein AHF37_06547 [Paragonimus kellicotti]